ncbi:MAG: VWA domain-containing protein [Candidatus Latescibacterota bacterium]|nr:VWA domain-containing protein [Candidatus Latescibacterota bacterium]
MQNLRFENPEWLLLLILLPFLLYVYIRRRRFRQSSVRYSDVAVFNSLKAPPSIRLRHLLIGLKLLGIALLIVAMARPQAGRSKRQVSSDGIDIMLTLDVSSSMELNDLDNGERTRLQVAKQVVSDFISGRQNDRIGMVVFAGESFTQCPLTLDYKILLEFLKGIPIAEKSWDGTAIGMALINAVNRLREAEGRSQVIILLTDGVNNAGEIDPQTAAETADAVGVRVYTIGIGSDGSIRRAVPGIFGARYQNVDVEIDEETLRIVAEKTGGKYYRATSEEKLEQIYEEIGQLERTEITSEIHVEYSERYTLFLWAGLLLLLCEILLSNTRFRSLP